MLPRNFSGSIITYTVFKQFCSINGSAVPYSYRYLTVFNNVISEYRQFDPSTTTSSIVQCSESLMLALYDGSDAENMNRLRYKSFTSKVITNSSSIQVQTLPPTTDAAAQHSLRVFYQTQVWMGNRVLNINGRDVQRKKCCKQCAQVRFMGTMTKWPVQKHTEHNKTRSIQRRNRH